VTHALIIGAGHNGLTCAAYLARAGLDVTVGTYPGAGVWGASGRNAAAVALAAA
jgi:phytoene dehydrogenase-like protein